MRKIIQKRNIFYVFSGTLIVASIIAMATWGLHYGIDFTGGVLMELKFANSVPLKEEIQTKLQEFNLRSVSIQPAEDNKVLVRYVADEENPIDPVEAKLKNEYPAMTVDSAEYVSSSISSELKQKALYALAFAVIGIAAYIAWAFRSVSYPIESWKYGVAAVVALFHDIIITVGIFSFLGKFYGVEVNIPFIAALLTILGYSVNDTIVVFDRVRENLIKAGAKKEFEETVNRSINETLARSINTSMTVMIVLLCIILLGGANIRDFVLALFIGVFYGTYSSIFVASALLVDVWKYQQRAKN